MAVAFEDFLTSLREFTAIEHGGVSQATELLKSANSSIASVDEALKSITVTEAESGALLFNKKTAGTLYNTLREADLNELIRISDSEVVYSAADAKQFKSLVGKTPESQINDIEQAVVIRKREFPHLDVVEEDIPQMSNTAKSDLKKIESSLMRRFKEGTTIALTIGVIVVGVDWVTKALEARKGCFLVTNINNKVTSCKIQDFSCINQSKGNFCTNTPPVYNTTLQLIAISELPDTDETKIKIAKLAELDASKLKDNLDQIIDKHFKEADKIIKDLSKKFTVNTCVAKNEKIEGGKVPPCRLCSPTANPTSTEFVDPAQYADNVTFKCVVNPSILEVITDAAIATGVDLFDVVSKSLFQLLKPLMILGAILLLIAIIIYAVFKAVTKRQQHQELLNQNNIQQQPIIYRNN